MKQGLIRVAVALWFIGMVGLAIGGRPMAGQAGEPPKQYFPLMSANVPAQTDPAFRDYVGVGVSDDDGDAEIYTIRGDDSELRQLTQNETNDLSPSFSPDGTRIAFSRISQVGNSSRFIYQIYVINRDGSNETLLFEVEGGPSSLFFIAKWSPRGQHLLVYGQIPETRAWVVALDGTAESLGSVALDLLGWSPDGRYITYATSSLPTAPLQIRNVFTGASVAIGSDIRGVWWSPNSRDLLVRQGEALYFVVNDGSELRLAVTGAYAPQGWLRNGHEFLIQATTEADKNFYTVSRDGGDPQPLTAYTDLYVTGGMEATRSGIFYQVYATDGTTISLYWLSFATRTPRFLQTYERDRYATNPVLSYDRSTLLYDLERCEVRTCSQINHSVRLDDADALPIASGSPPAPRYLPLSSNRAFVQYGGYPGYERNTIRMVQFQRWAVSFLNFPRSSRVRYISEWKYLP